jgi:hypothetical protein
MSNNLAGVPSVFPKYNSCTDFIAILTIIRQNVYGSAYPASRNENCAQELREENSSAGNPPSDLNNSTFADKLQIVDYID